MAMVVGAAVLAGLGILMVWASHRRGIAGMVQYVLLQLGGGLLTASAGALLVPLFIDRYRDGLARRIQDFLVKDVTHALDELKYGVTQQTNSLFVAGSSLGSLSSGGITRVFRSRDEASSDLEREIQGEQVAEILLMGISLNDFVRSDQPDLHRTWKILSSYIRGDSRLRNEGRQLDIKVLVIQPLSFGATLRSFGESREPDEHAGRLSEDVHSTAEFLFDLRRQARKHMKTTGVTFDFRLYNLPPTLFLCHTNLTTYVQPYYFWSKRHPDTSLPVLKCGSGTLQRAMRDHFTLIWDHASTGCDEWLNCSDIGIDHGGHQTGMINIYHDPEQAARRMSWALEHATDRVWLQGISLRSFFQPGPLYAAMIKLLERSVDVRVLLIDQSSTQAQYRSFREHALSDHCDRQYDRFDDYSATPSCHRDSTLVRDSTETMSRIRSLVKRWPNSISARMYDSAPSCFLLLVDDAAFVEQYHYGKVVPDDFKQGTPPVLGKDMPLIEYGRSPRYSELYISDRFRSPYGLLESNFEFVFEQCAVDFSEPHGRPSKENSSVAPRQVVQD